MTLGISQLFWELAFYFEKVEMRSWMKPVFTTFAINLMLMSSVFAQPDTIKNRFANVLIAFGREDYDTAVKELAKIYRTESNGKWYDYYAGLAYLRLGRYDHAIRFLRRSLALKTPKPDVPYELGQAYYAESKLHLAYKSFALSYNKGFKKNISLYYLAHLNQLLEKNQNAYKLYKQLSESPGLEANLKQVAIFQMADVKYLLNENNNELRGLCRNSIIPLMESAITVDPKSAVVKDIEKRITEIKARHGLHPDYMISGIRKPKSFTQSAFVSQGFTYDNNITLATDLPTAQSSNRDAFVFETSATYFQNHFRRQRFTYTPSISMSHIIHSDRDSSDVITNDGYDMEFDLKTRIDHYFGNKTASATFDIGFEYTARDKDSTKDYGFFNRAWSFSIGESLPILDIGPTAFTYKFRRSYSYDIALDNDSHTLIGIQTYRRENNHLLLFMGIYNINNVVNDEDQNTSSLTLRGDYIAPDIIPKFIFNAGFGVTFTDTKAQSDERGTEKTYNPSIKITRIANHGIRATFFYDYLRNTSLDRDSRDYSKHKYGFELKYVY